MTETYSTETAKEFALQRLRLTPDTLGRNRNDVPTIVQAIGGLQFGGHKIELFNRFQNFKPEWFDHWYDTYTLIEGHILRGALRIVTADEYPYYFKATRSVARKRKYQSCPASLNENHHKALAFISTNGPLTSSEFAEQFSTRHSQPKSQAKKLLQDLYNYGKIARMGRKNQKPLFHAVEKLPYKLNMSRISEKEAKKWLLLKCLTIFGPFRLKDIAHWTGWNLTETKKTLLKLLHEKKVTPVKVSGYEETHYIRTEDIQALNSIDENPPEHSFLKILFNDDAFLLGHYHRLKQSFGYDWHYPQLSEAVWKAAILRGRELIGEAVVEMYTDSSLLEVKTLVLRKQFCRKDILKELKNEFERHAKFHRKTLSMSSQQLISV